MTHPFPIVLSPYDLDARGLVADVAFLLGSPAITLLPAPYEGFDAASVNAAAASAPEFLRLINRWSWMQDLWNHAVIRPEFTGLQPLEFVQEAAQDILEGGTGSPLSSVMRSGVFDSTHTYLKALCRDLTLGGGQPSVSVPVTIGLSRYAHAIDAPILQQHARHKGSVVQKLESRATRSIASFSVLLPRDIEPETTLALRDSISEPLHNLRMALQQPAAAADPQSLHTIESAFSAAILHQAARHDLSTAPKRGRRLATVLISVATMPAEAPLAAAMRASTLATRRPTRSSFLADTSPAALAQRPLRVLSVRELPWQHPSS